LGKAAKRMGAGLPAILDDCGRKKLSANPLSIPANVENYTTSIHALSSVP
jgi:hypothetical protein